MFGRSFSRERERLALRLDEEVRAALSDAQIPPINGSLEEVYGEYALGRLPERREMRFFLEDVAAFTPGLVTRIRRLISAEFPKWTVVPQFVEREFTVSAAGVNFGETVVRGPIDADTLAFRDWLAAALEYDERRNGPLRRQVRCVLPRVPEAIRRLVEERFVVLGVFDRYRPPYTGGPIWILFRPADRETCLTPPESPAARYPVNRDGTLHHRFSKRFDILTGEEPAAWLTVFVPDVAPGKWVEVVDASKRPIGRLELPAPIADDDLKTEGR